MSLFNDDFEKQQRLRHNSQQEHAFGHQNRHYDNHRERRGGHDSHFSQRRDRDAFSQIGAFVQKLVHNKTLLVLVGLVLVVALGLFVAAMAFILPLVPKLLGYLDINGFKSLLDQGMAILGKVLAIVGK